jgi:hypothetical protein
MDTDVSRKRGSPRTDQGDEHQESDFASTYPSIAKWVNGYGWIEMGDDLPGIPQRSFVRALDEALGTWIREDLGE